MRRYWGKYFLLLGFCAIWMLGQGGEPARGPLLRRFENGGCFERGSPPSGSIPSPLPKRGLFGGSMWIW